MNLWEIKEEYLRVLDMTDDSDIDEQTINDTLESLNFALEDKVDNYSRFIKQLEADSLTIKNRMDSDEKKLKRKDHLIDTLKNRIQETMKELDKDKIKTDLFEIKIVNNGGLQKMVLEEDKVPIEYMETKYIINNSKIREDITKGKLENANWVKLLPREQHITIR